MILNIKKIIQFSLIFIIFNLFFCTIFLFSDSPDYYTGLGLEYDVKYYSYFIYDENIDDYIFIDEKPIVDLEHGTFYKVILKKDSDSKLIGAFYLMGKLKWAISYDSAGNIIRIEKHDENGEISSDKHYDRNGNLFFEVETGVLDIYQPRHNRKPDENIQYVIAYITKGQGVEISDRRDIKKWYKGTVKKDVIRHKYYNTNSDIIYMESVFRKNNRHLYDRKFYYDSQLSKILYTEYYSNEELIESAYYVYNGDEIREIEYRGKDDSGIVREIYENGEIKQTIVYYNYYLEEIIINYEENSPISAIHYRYDSTLRLLKIHEYIIENGRFVSEVVKDPFGAIYEVVNYEYNDNLLTNITRDGIRKGSEYSISVNYSHNEENKVSNVSISGTYSGALNYNYNTQGDLLNITGGLSNAQMIYYTNSEGVLNIDVLSTGNNIWEIYNKEEKVIASKKISGNSIITISNEGVISQYETKKDDKIQIIHFSNGKPKILETLSEEDRSPLQKDYFDESGKIIKSISYDPENYSENFIEYDENGKMISEYKLNAEGNLIAKLFYDDKERPHLYEEYNTFGVVTFYSIRTYDDETGRLINYSSYKNFRNKGFKISSVQLYGEGNLPEVVFIFDDLNHMITTVQFNNKDGEETKFIWRKITGLNVTEEHRNYIKDTVKKISYARSNAEKPRSNELKSKNFYSKIK